MAPIQVILNLFLPNTQMAPQNYRKPCYLYTITFCHETANIMQITFKN